MKWERPEGCQAKRGLHPALWHVEVYSAAEAASYHLVASGLHSKLGFLWRWCSWKWYCAAQTNRFCRQSFFKRSGVKRDKKTKLLSHKLLTLCCQTPATFLPYDALNWPWHPSLPPDRSACEARDASPVSLEDLSWGLVEKTWHVLGTGSWNIWDAVCRVPTTVTCAAGAIS